MLNWPQITTHSLAHLLFKLVAGNLAYYKWELAVFLVLSVSKIVKWCYCSSVKHFQSYTTIFFGSHSSKFASCPCSSGHEAHTHLIGWGLFFLSLAHRDEFITVHVVLEKANGNFLLQKKKKSVFHFYSVLCFKKILLLLNIFHSIPFSFITTQWKGPSLWK